MNLFILDKNYNKIGMLSNQGANPIAPFFDDVYTQELDTGADTYEFSTISTYLTQELMEIGNHIIFEFNNEHKLFVIADIEFSHKNGMNTINVYCEGIGFELLEKYVDKFEVEGNFNNLLGIVLVGTGWKHEVGSKVTAIKKMSYNGEKNILAIIQDAIKEYDGVEIKFEVDYSESIIKKKVRVYENGGRGSHIGYRFEYGQNVNGITKKEEMADSKDDTVLFANSNDIGILLEYSVDVAMRSEEIAQLEIGDTHYVIDHDFNPPITLEARVGKLEISFSDPTKNKVTLANFKHATGAISQKTHKGDVSNIADNAVQDAINEYSDHTHPLPEHTHPELAGSAGNSNDLLKAPRMHSYEFLLYTSTSNHPNSTSSAGSHCNKVSCVDLAPSTFDTFSNKQIHDYLMYETDVWDVSYKALDQLRYNKTGDSGATNKCFRLTPSNSGKVADGPICDGGYYGDTDYMRECELKNEVSSRIFSDIMGQEDRATFDINGYVGISNNHFDKHMLDVGSLACGLVSALQYHVKNGNHGSGGSQIPTTTYNSREYYDISGTGFYIGNGSKPLLIGTGQTGRDITNVHRLTADVIFCEGDQVTDGIIQCSRLVCDNPSMNSDKSLKENIRYIDAPTTYSNEDLLEKADLYDFIVNQVNICEFNYIGKSADKIGFIANDYEGTKVGDKIVSKDKETELLSYDISNLLFATIGALQEEVRTKDEKIASLEARLARIEAMLGTDNE